MRYRVMWLWIAMPLVVGAQQFSPELPRFRAGTNLVRVDAYVSTGDSAVTDLTAGDFAIFEDDAPQKVESFELIRARAPVSTAERRDPANARDMRQQAASAARLFTMFFDQAYVGMAGAYHVRAPLTETLDTLIGPDDMVGAMTPDMPPSAITYGRRTDTIERMLQAWWIDAARRRFTQPTDTDLAIAACYPPSEKQFRGIAGRMTARLREERTLDALDALISHLDGLRPDRKFVMVFTEGWPLFRPDPFLSRALDTAGPIDAPTKVDPATGSFRRRATPDAASGMAMTSGECDQLRLRLAQLDHERRFYNLLQVANRANVSFYPIDARGLVVFDKPLDFNLLPTDDQAGLRHRWDFLRDMATQTDGHAVLDEGDLGRGMQKAFRDLGSYYLLGYYSTSRKLDGRFRRIRVEVKRPGASVRARPGYLAPTEAEARAAGNAIDTAVAAAAAVPPTVSRALDALTPTRGHLPVRMQAAGGAGSIHAIVELDAATTKQSEWMTGSTMRLTFQREGGSDAAVPAMTLAIEPGQRSIAVDGPDALAPGRYMVRAELTPRGSRSPMQVSAAVEVEKPGAPVGTAALAYRRGPGTGLSYVPTADARFRRTERIRVEVPIAADAGTARGRLLTRDGRTLPLTVTYQVRTDALRGRSFGQAEVILSPLAAGDYVLELSFATDGAAIPVAYGFRVVP